MIKNLKDLENAVYKNIDNLMAISPAYLSDAGKAALEAYKSVYWYCGFYETLKGLRADENFRALVNISDKHPEYYSVLRSINKAIDKAVESE